MFRRIINRIKCRWMPMAIKRAELKEAAIAVTRGNSIVILGNARDGLRVVILERGILATQLGDIAKTKEVQL